MRLRRRLKRSLNHLFSQLLLIALVGVVTVLGIFAVVYLVARGVDDWRHWAGPWSPALIVILFVASCFLLRSRVGWVRKPVTYLNLLFLIFLGQIYVWGERLSHLRPWPVGGLLEICLTAGIVVYFYVHLLVRLRSAEQPHFMAGYVYLEGGGLEHRHVATQVLGRALAQGEVVHHINGIRNDNRPENLCVLDGTDHELFHAWLAWRKKKMGRYPSPEEQRSVLTKKYQGRLL